MTDAMPRKEPSKYSPNGCDHPYKKVEETSMEMSVDGLHVRSQTITVCRQCGYILEPESISTGLCAGPYTGRPKWDENNE